MSTVTGKGKTEEDFKGRFVRATVIPRKIDAALAQLGSKGYEDNMGFTRRAGVSATDLAAFREQYQDYIIEAREVGGDGHMRILWCGSKEFAKRLRGLLDGNQD